MALTAQRTPQILAPPIIGRQQQHCSVGAIGNDQGGTLASAVAAGFTVGMDISVITRTVAKQRQAGMKLAAKMATKVSKPGSCSSNMHTRRNREVLRGAFHLVSLQNHPRVTSFQAVQRHNRASLQGDTEPALTDYLNGRKWVPKWVITMVLTQIPWL